MSDRHAHDLVALIYRIAQEVIAEQPKGERGVIVPGSYRKDAGTVQVLIGTTAALIMSDAVQPLARPNLPLMTMVHGMQAGPKGGERCVVVHVPGGRGVYLVHDTDDSPGAPAGEYWYVHPDSKSSIKFTNDGPAQGDALGGVRMHGAAYHGSTTGSGHAITLDDVAKILTVASADGQSRVFDDTAKTITDSTANVKTILDGAGNAISHVAQQVGLGDRVANLPSTQAVFRQADVQKFSQSIMTQMMQSFASVYANAMAAAQIPNAGPFAAIVQAAGWVTGNVTPPTIPTGSSIVRAA